MVWTRVRDLTMSSTSRGTKPILSRYPSGPSAALEVNAPLPGFVLKKISNAIVSAALPAMFASITREVAARKKR